MKVLIVLALASLALAAPRPNPWAELMNPDERGPYYQGDIMLPSAPLTRNGIIDTSYRWPNGQMAYQFSAAFSQAQIDTVLGGMADYTSKTGGCITFKERTTESNYVLFTQSDSEGCFSYVGMVGGAQRINYPQWCLDQYGSVLHEMYHAFGFYHEQSRSDRDDYVTIMWENIESGAENNFDKYPDTVISGFGQPYDYGSMMHYSAYAFSSNGQKTIVTTDPNAVIGQRDGFSQIDINKIMAMYNC